MRSTMRTRGLFRVLIIEASGVNAETSVEPPGMLGFECVQRRVDDFIDFLADHAFGEEDESEDPDAYERAVHEYICRLGRFNLIIFHEEAWERTWEYNMIYEAITSGQVVRYVLRRDGSSLERLDVQD